MPKEDRSTWGDPAVIPVIGPGGNIGWICVRCGLSHGNQQDAEACCRDKPVMFSGGDIPGSAKYVRLPR